MEQGYKSKPLRLILKEESRKPIPFFQELNFTENDLAKYKKQQQNIYSNQVANWAEYIDLVISKNKNFNYTVPEGIKELYNPLKNINQEKEIADQIDEEYMKIEYLNKFNN